MSWFDDERAPGNKAMMTAAERDEQNEHEAFELAVTELIISEGLEFTDADVAVARARVLAATQPAARTSPVASADPRRSITFVGGRTHRGPITPQIAAELDAYAERLAGVRNGADGHPVIHTISNMALIAHACRLMNGVSRDRDSRNPRDLHELRSAQLILNKALAHVPGGRAGLEAHYQSRPAAHRSAPARPVPAPQARKGRVLTVDERAAVARGLRQGFAAVLAPRS